eukprot:1129380-Alexandrium_andersonii.AAC.1
MELWLIKRGAPSRVPSCLRCLPPEEGSLRPWELWSTSLLRGQVLVRESVEGSAGPRQHLRVSILRWWIVVGLPGTDQTGQRSAEPARARPWGLLAHFAGAKR